MFYSLSINFMKAIFFNQFERLRSGWRAAVFLFLFTFFGVVSGGVVELLFKQSSIDFRNNTVNFILLNSTISFITALLIGWFCGKYLENLPFRALGSGFTKNWLKDFGIGLFLGALSLCAAAFTASVFGGLSFQLNRTDSQPAILQTLAFSLFVFIVGAASEEMLFRGYIFQTFARSNLGWLSIGLTSLFFAIGHLGNSDASYISTLNTALAGVWFGIAYLKTRTLWFVFGLHLMWNWFQGAIFGIEVSGIKSLTAAPLFQEIDKGPIWLTGENYGIEGGIACTFAIIISILLIWFLPVLKPTGEMLALTGDEKAAPRNN